MSAMNSLLQDLQHALRMIRRNPGFAAVTIFTLALGIATSTTVFGWVDTILLHPLPGVQDPDRLVALETLTPGGAFAANSYPDYIDFRDHLKLVSGVAVTLPAAFSVGQEDHAERVWGELVSGNFFAVLGAKAELGRTFLPEEYGDKPGAFPVAVISDRFWRSHFDADPQIVGKTIRVNQHELTIVGVAAPEFRGSMPGEARDIWVPYMMQPVLNGVAEWMLRDRKDRNMIGMARLKPGITLQQAQQEIAALASRMAKADADTNEGLSATLLPIAKSHFGPQSLLLAPLRLLLAVCAVVLLIVCANVANLLLARTTARHKEFSTRMALGAGHARIAQQVFVESLVLAAAAGLAGLFATQWLGRALVLLLPAGTSLAIHHPIGGRLLLFTASLCGLVAFLTGIFPALQLKHTVLNERLNEAGKSGMTGARSHRMRSVLITAEVSLALVALIAAGLFAQSFQALREIKPGFDPNHVLLSQFYLSTNGYNLEQRKEFCLRLSEKLKSSPGVVDVAYSDGVPLGFEPSWWEDLNIEGYTPGPAENMKIFRNVISPGYLPLMRIPLVDGRDFTEHDDEKSNPVMIVNQAFVKRFFAGRNPIGRRIRGWGEWFTVVGVAHDSKYHYPGEAPLPYFYVPFRQVYRADMHLAYYVRTVGDPKSVLPLVRQRVREIDPNVTVFDAVPLTEYIGASLYPQKIAASFLTMLGSLAVVLAAVGLYSVMSYSVVQRTHEIGIRMALGARPEDVLRLVVRQGLILASVGLLVGLGLAIAVGRGLSAISFATSAMGSGGKLLAVSAADPLLYGGAALFLTAVAALAAYIPARRAAKVEPIEALRYE
ncbi:MAG TPA: ABC transporter permease [Alloacidobacterium sp.]|nr:ABC transporter permease [Alloacidobacterium sp.]